MSSVTSAGESVGNQRARRLRFPRPAPFRARILFGSLSGRKRDKHRRAQQSIGRHFQILDLGHQLRLQPGDIAQRLHGSGERAFLGDERFDFGVNVFERFLVESRAHLSGVRQLFAVIKPEHQRAEVVALAVRESADDEIVRRYHFDLHPIAAAASFVFAAARFGHDAFQAVGARGFEHRIAIHGEEVGNMNALGWRDNFRQQALALFERYAAQIVAIEIQQIEQEKVHRGGSREMRDRVWVGHRDARLDQAEAGAAFVIQHCDLAVQDGLRCFDMARQHAQLGILLVAALSDREKMRSSLSSIKHNARTPSHFTS